MAHRWKAASGTPAGVVVPDDPCSFVSFSAAAELKVATSPPAVPGGPALSSDGYWYSDCAYSRNTPVQIGLTAGFSEDPALLEAAYLDCARLDPATMELSQLDVAADKACILHDTVSPSFTGYVRRGATFIVVNYFPSSRNPMDVATFTAWFKRVVKAWA